MYRQCDTCFYDSKTCGHKNHATVLCDNYRLDTTKVSATLKPCPFCGTDLSDYPLIMVLKPVYSEEYLIAKLNKGHFLGGDNGYEVRCIKCGASGGRDTIPEVAVQKWNRRDKKRQNNNAEHSGEQLTFEAKTSEEEKTDE